MNKYVATIKDYWAGADIELFIDSEDRDTALEEVIKYVDIVYPENRVKPHISIIIKENT